jgi:hypothetical protein
MNNVDIVLNIIGVLMVMFVVISIQQKTKDKLLIYMTIANILYAVQYFLLGKITGEIILIVCIIRCLIFYYYSKKNLKPSLTFLIIFIICYIVFGILSWQDIFSILPICAWIIYTYGIWQDNMKITRICAGLNSIWWAIYNVIIGSFILFLKETIELCSATISIIRQDILKKTNKL